MNVKLNFQSRILGLIFTIFLLVDGTELIAQNIINDNLKEFKITVQRSDNSLKLTCDKGCAWIALSFSLEANQAQSIDQYGMVTIDERNVSKSDNLADFQFIITRTYNAVQLKSTKGTSWKNLDFSLYENDKQSFTQLGVGAKD